MYNEHTCICCCAVRANASRTDAGKSGAERKACKLDRAGVSGAVVPGGGETKCIFRNKNVKITTKAKQETTNDIFKS